MHVHTALCGHASGDVAQMVRGAARAGVDIVAITDHLPLPPGYDPSYAMREDQLSEYVREVLQTAHATSSAGGPEVLLGIEADWLPGRDAELAKVLGALPFDVVIGSVHFVEGWAFDDPALIGEWDERDAGDVWRAYFAELERAAGTGLFDVMAHPDLVKKFGHVPGFDPLPLYRSAAEAFSVAGVAVEVSTAGLRKPVGEIYPARAFLQECFRAGVPATTGSDAHDPSEVGHRLADAETLLRSVGYESVAVFRSRCMEMVPIGEATR